MSFAKLAAEYVAQNVKCADTEGAEQPRRDWLLPLLAAATGAGALYLGTNLAKEEPAKPSALRRAYNFATETLGDAVTNPLRTPQSAAVIPAAIGGAGTVAAGLARDGISSVSRLRSRLFDALHGGDKEALSALTGAVKPAGTLKGRALLQHHLNEIDAGRGLQTATTYHNSGPVRAVLRQLNNRNAGRLARLALRNAGKGGLIGAGIWGAGQVAEMFN